MPASIVLSLERFPLTILSFLSYFYYILLLFHESRKWTDFVEAMPGVSNLGKKIRDPMGVGGGLENLGHTGTLREETERPH